jgi:uracil-DNA glycosylase family 4
MPSSEELLKQALTQKNLRYVGNKGNLNSKVVIIGEAPGKEEDRSGIPFVGYSGKLLDEMLLGAGFKSNDYWITNAYKTRPPNNEIKRISELGIPLILFHDEFFSEIRTYKPTIIISCGRTPTNLLCPFTQPKAFRGKNPEDKEGFGSWRGSLLTSPHFDWPHYVIPMYHPAFVLRNYSEKEVSCLIVQRSFEEYTYFNQNHGRLKPLPIRNLVVNPKFEVCYNFLRRCLCSPNAISIDIELLKRKVPYTISFAISPMDAMSMSFWNYTTLELSLLWRQIDDVFKTKKQIGQNYYSFDCRWLRCLGFSPNMDLVEDTLIRHHILWPGLPHKLEFMAMQYTREPYWKEEGKGWSLREGLDRLMLYNAKDAAVTYEIFSEQEKEFDERKS